MQLQLFRREIDISRAESNVNLYTDTTFSLHRQQ